MGTVPAAATLRRMTTLIPESVTIVLGNVGLYGVVQITTPNAESTTWQTIRDNPAAFAEVVRQFVEDNTAHTPTIQGVSTEGRYEEVHVP